MVKKVNAEKTAETNTKSTLRVLTLMILFGFLSVFNPSNAIALTGYSVITYCSERCNCEGDEACCCAITAQGTCLIGHNAVSEERPTESVLDSRRMGITNEALTTNIFLIDDITPAGDTIGRGFLDVYAEYNLMNSKGIYFDDYLFSVQSSEKITDYNEWLTKCYELADASIKAKVYPNPSSDIVTVELDADYVAACKVTSVRYNLYRSGMELINTFTPDDLGAFQIPAEYTINTGTYFIVCDATKADGTAEQITLSFIIR